MVVFSNLSTSAEFEAAALQHAREGQRTEHAQYQKEEADEEMVPCLSTASSLENVL